MDEETKEKYRSEIDKTKTAINDIANVGVTALVFIEHKDLKQDYIDFCIELGLPNPEEII